MVAGQLVFPIVMGAVILFVSGYVISTPAAPAPEDPQQERLRVQAGDRVLLEVTGYYGEPGNSAIFFSTQEERHAQLPRGEIVPQLQSSPVTFTVGNVDRTQAQGLDLALLGRSPGDSFTTDVIPASLAFGDWEGGERSLPRAIATLPIRVEFTAQTQIAPNRYFNATDYADFFEEEGYQLEPGTVFPCEDQTLWDCRLVSLDLTQNRLVYERIIEDGARYPADAVIRVETDEPWEFIVRNETADSFQVLLDPPAGNRFQLRQALRDPYRAGTYEVVRVTEQDLVVRYAPTSEANPALVGRPVYYDLVVLRIIR